ncbi:hypothetical protein [Lacticaseibacillus mingshuiensis]|uniref:hypothetical protein n=1 Tax=Lacticaseibacillus mingshuiensis TaxID=2799574 RepID=UPI00194ECCE4|nr:hypothetical protein [Lacticaseibacillus mingshuiensis]
MRVKWVIALMVGLGLLAGGQSVQAASRNGAAGAEVGQAQTSVSGYVTVTAGNFKVWTDASLQRSVMTTASLKNRTFRVRSSVQPHDVRYLELIDQNGAEIGFLNENATLQTNANGACLEVDRYVTVTKGNYALAQDLSGHAAKTTAAILNQTFRVKYVHPAASGINYLSLYNGTGKLVGIVDEGAVAAAPGSYGSCVQENRYVTITATNFKLYRNFAWQVARTSASVANQTFYVKYSHRAISGATFLSVYDKNERLVGIINESATDAAKGPQGTAELGHWYARVATKSAVVWRDFSWKTRAAGSTYTSQRLTVRGRYHHFNGGVYLSLYTSAGKWVGYVNQASCWDETGAASFLGTTRTKIVAELTAHLNDHYYLGTPYRGLATANAARYMVPGGVSSPYGVGMNCTGFVSYVLQRAGAKLSRLTGLSNQWGGQCL